MDRQHRRMKRFALGQDSEIKNVLILDNIIEMYNERSNYKERVLKCIIKNEQLGTLNRSVLHITEQM